MILYPTVSTDEENAAAAIRDLQQSTPLNEYGFPLGIYRSDILPMHDYFPETKAVDSLFGSRDVSRSAMVSPPSQRTDSDGSQVFSPMEIEDTDTDTEVQGTDEKSENGEDAAEDEDEDVIDLDNLNGDEFSDLLDGDDNDDDNDDDLDLDLQQRSNGSEHRGNGHLVSTQPIEHRVAGFRQQDLKAAFIPINFDEGFPALPNGGSFWDRLDHEPLNEYTCFQAYLQMPMVAQGVRAIGDLSQLMEQNALLEINGYKHEQFTKKFRVLSQIYYWPLRARAYDLYQAAAQRRQMELRGVETQNRHYDLARKLLTRLMTYFESEEEFWELMTPKVGIDMLKTLTGMERVSIGLPAGAPAIVGKDGLQSGQSFEMILRTLTQAGSAQVEAHVVDKSGDLASRILADPQMTKVAQELILRLEQQ